MSFAVAEYIAPSALIEPDCSVFSFLFGWVGNETVKQPSGEWIFTHGFAGLQAVGKTRRQARANARKESAPGTGCAPSGRDEFWRSAIPRASPWADLLHLVEVLW